MKPRTPVHQTKEAAATSRETNSSSLPVDDILAAAGRGDPIDRALPGGGRLRIDRPLPYLLVHRRTRDGERDDVEALISGEAAVLVLPDRASALEDQRRLVRALAEAGAGAFGSFLVLEVWSSPADSGRFRIRAPEEKPLASVRALAEGLAGLASLGRVADVVIEESRERQPPGLEPLLDVSEVHDLGVLMLGLEVPPLHVGPERVRYPIYFRALRRAFSRVLRQAVFEFVRVQTDAGIANYRVLGRSRLDDAVWEADRELARIEEAYDLLLLVSPVNEEEAWSEFSRDAFARLPDFRYRLLPFDPDLLKRRLYDLELERITDPAAGWVLHDKREELDRQISLLAERNSRSFLSSSIRLYGAAGDALLARARHLLDALPPERTRQGACDTPVDAAAFTARARREIEAYRADYPDLAATVQIRPDVVGLLVTRGHLLVGRTLRLSPARVEALIQHEVGTHVLTFWNGAAQPFEQLATGLAGYDEFQEGLAVLAEYLVGGLDRARMRLLAARVIAVHAMQDGATFIDVFRSLTRDVGFSKHAAFGIATRVFQSGGFTRDMIYLRGLIDLADHLRGGGPLEPLYAGKLARRHIDVLAELSDRGVLRAPPLLPRFLSYPGTAARLRAVRDGLTLAAMVGGEEAV